MLPDRIAGYQVDGAQLRLGMVLLNLNPLHRAGISNELSAQDS